MKSRTFEWKRGWFLHQSTSTSILSSTWTSRIPCVPGPSGHSGRPWSSLDKRLLSLVRTVNEYTTVLLAVASDQAAGPR